MARRSTAFLLLLALAFVACLHSALAVPKAAKPPPKQGNNVLVGAGWQCYGTQQKELYGTQLTSKGELLPASSTKEVNLVKCRDKCAGAQACKGFVYRLTRECIVLTAIKGTRDSSKWASSYESCKKL